ncbi:MAG: CHAT domain-containing protein [Caldilineaceae bacterium]
MDYLDFELRIGEGNGTEYPVTVIHAAAGGEPSITATLPVNDAVLRRLLDGLADVRSAQVATLRSTKPGRHLQRPSAPINERMVAREIGQRLFAALITGAVRDAYTSSLVKAREQKMGLRLRLRVEAPAVTRLPWEFLYDPQEGDHVSLLRETPLTRYTALTRERDTLPVKPPLRILGMVAAPVDLATLDVTQEQQRIAQALEHRLERGDVELHWVQGGTWQRLQQALDNGPWHVFHFIGHGAFDAAAGEGALAFCNDQGNTHFMSATGLGRLFSGHASLRLAFLNACEGGRTSDAELFSSVGAVLTRRGIPAVISMQFDITDQAALEFSRLFYDALAHGDPMDVAVTKARTGVSIALPERIEWATPMLHMRAPDGRLFTVEASAAIFDERKPVPRHTGSESAGWQAVDSGATDDAPKKRIPRGLDILRRKVQQYWIEGVLARSLFLQTWHDLGMELVESAVENPWRTQIERPGEPSRALPPGRQIADVFDEYGGSLLILGEPGAGKTTTMLRLMRTLLQRLERNGGQGATPALPVLFNLSSWSPAFPQLEEWLAAQMSFQYQIPQIDGRNLLAAGTILPLLDGLDEVGNAVRAQCVAAVNGYVLERNLTGLVLCCRLKEYTALPVRLALNTAVRLTDLSDEQVDGYLALAGDQLAGLRTLLHRETAVRFDARSPLWLNLMVRAYHGLSVADLAHEGEHNASARRRRLLDAYMARMFCRARGDEA